MEKNYFAEHMSDAVVWGDLMARKGAEGLPPLIITCAMTGGIQGKESNINIPETKEEQIKTAEDVYKAGASMLHIHCRKPDDLGVMTSDVEDYKQVNAAIRAKCPDLIINNTTMGGRFWFPGRTEPEAPLFTSLPAAPEVASIDMFTSYSCRRVPERPVGIPCPKPAYDFECAYTMDYRNAIEALKACDQYGVKPEFECTSLHDLLILKAAERKYPMWNKPQWFQLLVNGQGIMPSLTIMQEFARQLPKESMLSIIGIGPCQFAILAAAIVMGYHVRVGLEDNYMYSKGQLAESNVQMVERVVRLAKEIGRPIATPTQAREMMGLGAPRAY